MGMPLSAGVVVVAGAIVATATCGITVAVTSVPGRGYAACATMSGTLALRHHGHCPKGYRKVTIGARGLRGERGPTELPLMEEGYGKYGALTGGSASPAAVAVTPRLPAGRYDVTYAVDLENDGAAADVVACYGMASDGLVMPDNVVEDPGSNGHADITDTNAVDLTHSSAVVLRCYESVTIDDGQGGSSTPLVDFAHLVAVPVRAIN